MDADAIWRCVSDQRTEIADLLEGLDADQWVAQSLCDGWRVRDVAAHLTHSHMPRGRAVLEAFKSNFRFDPMIHRLAVEDQRSQAEIVAALRAMVGARRKVPGTSVQQPLIELLVHGQDIAVPLGIDLPMPTDAAVESARRLAGMRFPVDAAKQLNGIRLVASDAEFAAGTGREISAPISDIVMVLAGRSDPGQA